MDMPFLNSPNTIVAKICIEKDLNGGLLEGMNTEVEETQIWNLL